MSAIGARSRRSPTRRLRRFSKGTPCAFLCDLTKCKATDLDARNHCGTDEGKLACHAMALVGGRPVGQMIGNLVVADRDRGIRSVN